MLFVGDIHGQLDLFEKWLNFHSVENTNIIQVGDFGLGFKSKYEDINDLDELNRVLEASNNNLYVIRGNHDNPEFWSSSNQDFVPPLIHLIKDGEIIKIEGKRILCIGGGISIDRMKRRQDISYWSEEVINKEIINNCNVDNIDIIVTHVPFVENTIFTPPDESPLVINWDIIEQGDLIFDLEEEQNLLSNLNERVKDNNKNDILWISGHFHNPSYIHKDNIEYLVLADLHSKKDNEIVTYSKNKNLLNHLMKSEERMICLKLI